MRLTHLRNLLLPLAALLIALAAIRPTELLQNVHGYLSIAARYWWLEVAILSPVVSLIVAAVIVRRSRETSVSTEPTIFASRQDSAYQLLLRDGLKRGRRIDVAGISNNRLTSDVNADFYRELLLERDGSVRLIFLEPGSSAMRERENLEGRAAGSLSGLAQHNIEDLRRFCRVLNLSEDFIQERLQVRVLDYFSGINMIIVDQAEVFVHHYGRKARGFDYPALHLTSDQNKTSTQFFVSEFESLWREGSQVPIGGE